MALHDVNSPSARCRSLAAPTRLAAGRVEALGQARGRANCAFMPPVSNQSVLPPIPKSFFRG
eukprot:4555002-Lingulodinium_polyedra.AAC.1